jgi:UDP-2,3-diacylglucosamine pyrophosphatase LpxH
MDKARPRGGEWTISRGNDNVVVLTVTQRGRGASCVSFSSDHHLDSPKCRRDLVKQNLERAAASNAPVVMIGDLFDVMGCQRDPRASKHGLRPEYAMSGKDYLDAVVDDVVEILAPYASTIALICRGNHESAIQRNNEVCVTSRVVERLRLLGSQAVVGGYAGWLWIRRRRPGESGTMSYRVFWHHGSGGGGSTTRGIGEFARIGDYIEGADAIICGHNHQRGIYEVRRQRLTSAGRVVTGSVHHVRCGCFKDEFVGNGWAVEKGMGPRPMGGWVLQLKPDRARERMDATWIDSL